MRKGKEKGYIKMKNSKQKTDFNDVWIYKDRILYKNVSSNTSLILVHIKRNVDIWNNVKHKPVEKPFEVYFIRDSAIYKHLKNRY